MPEPQAPPLRDLMLDGHERWEALREFLFAPSARAIDLWFGDTSPKDVRLAIDRDLAAIEERIGGLIDAILHHPRFQALEARWRAVAWLVQVGEVERWAPRVKLRILNVSWAELSRDVSRAVEFDQSETFRKVYEYAFGIAGGEPFGLMIVDHELRHDPAPEQIIDDIATLEGLAGTAAAAFVPFIFAASPALLGLESFSELERVQNIGAVFGDRAHARWNALMEREHSQFLGVALPRILMRPPWTEVGRHGFPFRYNEDAPTARERTWAGAGFAFAAVVARAFAMYSWPADVRGADQDREGGGLVTGLPSEWFRTDPEGVWPRLPLEVILTGNQERALVDAGLMPVGALPFGHEILFEVTRSLYRPSRYVDGQTTPADANARLSSQINSVLCASRFAHHLKVMAREMIGSITTAESMQRRLQTWLNQYVNPNSSAGPELMARHPLADGVVNVQEVSGQPGVYTTRIHLQPHYQLDNIGAVFELETDVKRSAA